MRRAFRLGVHLQAGERLPLFAQNADNIVGGASTEPDQHKLHRTVRGLLFGSIDYDLVTTGSDTEEPFFVSPASGGVNHVLTSADVRFSMANSNVTIRPDTTVLSSVISLRFGMNEHPEKLWSVVLKPRFKRS